MSSLTFNPFLTQKLYGFDDNFNLFVDLYKKKNYSKGFII